MLPGGSFRQMISVADAEILDTDSDTRLTSLITEPVSGNIIIGGFADGMVKLWDTRTTRRQPLLAWDSSSPNLEERNALDRADVESIVKLGVTLGESKHITSAWYILHVMRVLTVQRKWFIAHL